MKMAEDDLIRMNKVLRHRLRNVASGIKTATKLVASEIEDLAPPEIMEYFPLIVAECDQVTELTNRMNLVFDPVPQKDFQPVNLIYNELREDLHADFPQMNINMNLDEAFTDGAKSINILLVDALKEVALNAIESTGNTCVNINFSIEEGQVSILVEDNGEGISIDNLQDIFLPFYTTKSRHVGIGMTIVKNIVDSSEGTVTAETSEQGGVRVTIKVPCLGTD